MGIFLHLLASGRIVLLLDAFDEMGTAAVGRSIEQQFRQLARPTARSGRSPKANRVLITCRTHFFRDQQQVKRAAAGSSDDLVSHDSELGKAAREFDAAIDELRLFDDGQIGEFLKRHLGEQRAAEAHRFIQRTYDLPNLAPRPVMLEMIVSTLPELMKSGGAVNPAGLYLQYTELWLKDRSGVSLQTSPEQRRRLLELLGFDLWGREQHRIHHRELGRLIARLPSQLLGGLDPVQVDLELRTAAFLTRTGDGYYGFSHKSFREYFYARHILRAAREGEERIASVLDTVALTPEVVTFLYHLAQNEDRGILSAATRAILRAAYRPRISENALRLAYRFSELLVVEGTDFATAPASNVMHSWMPERAQLQAAVLPDENLSGAWLAGAVMDRAVLSGANLSEVNAQDISLRKASLERAVMEAADFSGADFTTADLSFVEARKADFDHASFDGARLTAADLRHASLRDANLQRARLHATRLVHTNLMHTEWAGADLTAATLFNVVEPTVLPSGISAPPVGPRPYLRTGHSGPIRAAGFSADGSRAITAGSDGTARIWDAAKGAQLLMRYADAGGWFAVDMRTFKYRGEGATLDLLSYVDPEERALIPTHWWAEDLDYMRAD